ncbi:MAG: phytanoyl-CoA dioxygenase family protein, partial [Pseudomonadota bacterium]
MIAYSAGCDWFQPMDISLPGDSISHDTPMHFSQAVMDLVTNEAVLDCVESLLGGELTSNPIQHVRIKPPKATLKADETRAHVGGTAWHQDRAVAHAEADATDMVTVWCAITDATVKNGCLQAIPRHPGDAMRPHCPQVQTSIAPGYLDEREAVTLPVKAGGIVLLHPLTPHASLDNTSDSIRWSFDLRYNVTGQPTGRAHFPSFIARSRSNPSRELRDVETWRRQWEDARAQLAERPHINIHRWSADAPACA